MGNAYTTRFADAWDVVKRVTPKLEALERRTVSFVEAFCSSDLPESVKEAALFNASTLRTQTAFQTADGRFFGWEGCGDIEGCCGGSCTHVWNYEHTTAHLFGALSRSMRDTEFGHTTADDGAMGFRVALPIAEQPDMPKIAADGQMGTICRFYRDWRISGDDALLHDQWPAVKRALAFAWVPGGWDADRDGVMEGVQHNTMDVEYFGPNPQVGCWYLAALRACAVMAEYVGEADFAAECDRLYRSGSAWMDQHLFNGGYYEQQVRVPKQLDERFTVGMGKTSLKEPDWQIGPGCLTDQLVGALMARLIGLGDVLKPTHLRKTLRSIVKHNTQRGFADYFTNMRTYALGDDAGLILCSYPRGGRPRSPLPYFGEVFTGYEYTVAAHLLAMGMEEPALQIVRDARDRYNGANRNPFDEIECGHHYARAMASWGLILAATGFAYDGVEQAITFRRPPRRVTWFWSTGDAWGTVEIRPAKRSARLCLNVMAGRLAVGRVVLDGFGAAELPRVRRLTPRRSFEVAIPTD